VLSTQSDTAHLPAAALLAITGGVLDSVVYFNHGHVFANAMTGNLILLGIAAMTREWPDILRHVLPLAAFLAGIFCALGLRSLQTRYARLLALGLEIVTLGLLGALPDSFPPLVFIGTVSFVSAFQVTTFRHVGPFTYNSTFITGNLRDAANGLYESFTAPTPDDRASARAHFLSLTLICAAFLAGAILGAFVATRHPGHSLWAAEPTLLIVSVIILRDLRAMPA
jgi:uncharacterized membrane protein YoaK (UPF0700 family)